MKTFNKASAQGDVYLLRIEEFPEGIEPVKQELVGVHIVTHSETGHHHVIDAKRTNFFTTKDSEYDFYLEVLESCSLEHLRSHDTHAAIVINPGKYHVRRQREYTAEGFRKAQD